MVFVLYLSYLYLIYNVLFEVQLAILTFMKIRKKTASFKMMLNLKKTQLLNLSGFLV